MRLSLLFMTIALSVVPSLSSPIEASTNVEALGNAGELTYSSELFARDRPYDDGADKTCNVPASKLPLWIWTADTDAKGNQNVGWRYFRRTITSRPGKVAKWARISITLDNIYTLVVNGKTIATDQSFRNIESYYIPNLHPTTNLFAVRGYNNGGPGGLIAKIDIFYADNTRDVIRTDTTWKVCADRQLDKTYFQQTLDDSKWEFATDVTRNFGTKITENFQYLINA
ncbi:hypothetical protein HGRIS_013137 [Hohenbuehelia grisea]|uniref:Uncharacterized protein n=1 Tax=Hohenbuehelia grisea TaxID=104357 RepID=A0ABR3IUT6_9AGAR